MKLFINTTSPFARLVRIALIEKGLDGGDEQVVNAWQDDPDLLNVNTAARVPVLVTDEGMAISESLLVILRLEQTHPRPTLLDGDLDCVLARASVAYGVVEAAVHTLVGRVIAGPDFDQSPVGLRRRRSMLTGMEKLDADPPAYTGGTPNLDSIVAVVALDYIGFRFGKAGWVVGRPRLAALRDQLAGRRSFQSTAPHD